MKKTHFIPIVLVCAALVNGITYIDNTSRNKDVLSWSPLYVHLVQQNTPNEPILQTQSDNGEGSETSSLELIRKSENDGKERRIKIVKTGTSDETGIFTTCGPQAGDPENSPNVAVFSETTASGIQITIDKNTIRVPLAIVTQQQPKEGQEGSDGHIVASAGTARFLNPEEIAPESSDRLTRCEIKVTPQSSPNTVFVTQGRTELIGQKFIYDESDGIARIDGLITFKRDSTKDGLTGSSERIEVNVDAEKTTLIGNVILNSGGGRVSKAERVEYDDNANLARLIGTPDQPAVSIKGGDRLSAGMILYDLERNEVYAVKPEGGTITGEFNDGEDKSDTSTPANKAPDEKR